MIQDIAPYKYNVEYRNIRPEDDDFIIIREKEQLFVRKDADEISFPVWRDIKDDITDAQYLFEIEGAGRFFYVIDNRDSLIEDLRKTGFELITQRDIQLCMPKWAAFAGTTACHFIDWYDQNRVCGKCGRPMVHDENERMLMCKYCRIPVYPRINPVVIVGIIDGDRMLLTRYARSPYKRYALVAGFMEVGESVEQAVEREVFEETGLHVKNIRYYNSQPWSLSGSMILGLYCDLDGSDEVSLNDGELSVAEWVNRKDIPCRDDSVSVTSELMNRFRKGEV